MSLEESIKEMKEQLAEEEKKENEPEAEEVQEEENQDESEVEKPEEKQEEKVDDDKESETEKETKPEEKTEPEEKPDASTYQRMRRETAAAKRKTEELEAEVSRLKNANTEKLSEEVVTPSPSLPPELHEAAEEVRFKKAARQFQGLEAEFKRHTKDYDGVAAEYTLALAQSIKIQNPRMSAEEVAEQTRKSVLIKAANYMTQGYDPIEELYHEAKELGFTGKSFEKESPKEPTKEQEEVIKPDMKRVAANRARSSGMAGASGKSTGQLTPAAAADLSVAEFAKLSKAEKASVFSQLAARA